MSLTKFLRSRERLVHVSKPIVLKREFLNGDKPEYMELVKTPPADRNGRMCLDTPVKAPWPGKTRVGPFAKRELLIRRRLAKSYSFPNRAVMPVSSALFT